jgi:hypothetical protein
MPAAEWYDDLEDKGLGQFIAACRILETSFQSGRSTGGRWEKVGSLSKQDLREFKVTKPGSTAPHLRCLGVRDGQTVWLAVGFTKQKNKLTRQEIASGDSVTKEWRAERGE